MRSPLSAAARKAKLIKQPGFFSGGAISHRFSVAFRLFFDGFRCLYAVFG